jgi:hypothetical protein
MSDRTFGFLHTNERQEKPRTRGVTEIRGPYYTPMGPRYLEDVLETMGRYVEALKFAGGSFTLLPRDSLRQIIDVCHRHDVLVSTGGFIEYEVTQGKEAVSRYVAECKDVGFDIIEVSSGFITLPTDDWLRLVDRVQKAGLKAKPEVGIQFGAGGASAAEALESALREVDLTPKFVWSWSRSLRPSQRTSVGCGSRARRGAASRSIGFSHIAQRERSGHGSPVRVTGPGCPGLPGDPGHRSGDDVVGTRCPDHRHRPRTYRIPGSRRPRVRALLPPLGIRSARVHAAAELPRFMPQASTVATSPGHAPRPRRDERCRQLREDQFPAAFLKEAA